MSLSVYGGAGNHAGIRRDSHYRSFEGVRLAAIQTYITMPWVDVNSVAPIKLHAATLYKVAETCFSHVHQQQT